MGESQADAFRALVRAYVEENRPKSTRTIDAQVHTIVAGRLGGHRRQTVPWLNSTRSLEGCRVLEIGSGHGASAQALAEQGAEVVATDIDADALQLCTARFDGVGLPVKTQTLNAASIAQTFAPGAFDMIVFYASLEHMTFAERTAAIGGAFSVVRPGGLVVVAETPNRLWVFDSHSSKLPFFQWLPDDVAFEYAKFSPRSGYNDLYGGTAEPRSMEHFLRRGRGVSYHDFEIALDRRASSFDVVSSMQLHYRKRNPVRAAGWTTSKHGRFERSLREFAPGVHRGFLQPYLYLALQG